MSEGRDEARVGHGMVSTAQGKNDLGDLEAWRGIQVKSVVRAASSVGERGIRISAEARRGDSGGGFSRKNEKIPPWFSGSAVPP